MNQKVQHFSKEGGTACRDKKKEIRRRVLKKEEEVVSFWTFSYFSILLKV
jgi:hypothetical protein